MRHFSSCRHYSQPRQRPKSRWIEGCWRDGETEERVWGVYWSVVWHVVCSFLVIIEKSHLIFCVTLLCLKGSVSAQMHVSSVLVITFKCDECKKIYIDIYIAQKVTHTYSFTC